MKEIRSTNKSGIAHFVHLCTKYGLKKVVCSPGSRNAPLVIALDEHPAIETFVIHDERVAAFYALGMAQETGELVAVVCTSGSAMLNYYPAVSEAYYRSIPLVVLSADRPEEWVNHGDGQTIVQTGVYTNHIQWEGSIPETISCPSDIEPTVKEAFEAALTNWRGPIHFNFPLTEPLYGTAEYEMEEFQVEKLNSESETISESELEQMKEIWSNSERKMILVGQLDKQLAVKNALKVLGDDPSVAILVENTSNLYDQRWVHCIDRTLAAISPDEIEAFQPDLLITLGGAIISKRIKKFLRESNVKHHWKVGFDFPEMDTYRKLTRSFEMSAVDFLKHLNDHLTGLPTSNFGAKWKQRDFEVQARLEPFLMTVPYSDLSVFQLVLDFIPESAKIHMSNSSVVRYCQLFDPIPSMSYYANRGTSGIDGSTSTACGAALSGNGLHVLLTGDVSFFYDSNALWSAHLPKNLRIFLINNEGGGIFRIINGPRESDQLERYFEAKHQTKAEHICKAHGVEYMSAINFEEIENQMEAFFKEDSESPKLMEIFTPREENNKILDQFFAAAKGAE